MQANPIIQLDNVHKSFDRQRQSEKVLERVSFHVKKGEVVSILGQSGCGKSTILNMIGGFEHPSGGSVLLEGEPIQQPSRKCIMLFQHYGLLPWRSVLKNVELGLDSLELSEDERTKRAKAYLDIVGLGDKTELFPRHLSGGMQQRVAIARALAAKPELVLMDEPFAALDTFNRYYLQDELLRIQQQEKTTIILVTHDIDEAIYLSDRILIMGANPGRIIKELKLTTAKPRDRSHGDFQHFRKIIFEQFQFSHTAEAVDYNI